MHSFIASVVTAWALGNFREASVTLLGALYPIGEAMCNRVQELFQRVVERKVLYQGRFDFPIDVRFESRSS